MHPLASGTRTRGPRPSPKTMQKGRNISYKNDLFEVLEDNIVPSGVAELSHLQQMGYTYIKP